MVSLFTSPEPIEHEVSGQIVKFWPISVGLVFRLRGLAKPLARSVAALFTNADNDTSVEEISQGTHRKISKSAISSELAKLRFEQRQVAVEQLTEGLLNDASAKVLAEVCIDSMREAFIKKETPVEKFLAEIPAPAFMEMLSGVAKANKKLFDPLKKAVEGMASTILQSARPGNPAETQPEESPSIETTTASG